MIAPPHARSTVRVTPSAYETLLAKAWLAASRQRIAEARQFAGRAARFTREHGQLAREVTCLQTPVQFGDTSPVPRLAELAVAVERPRAPPASPKHAEGQRVLAEAGSLSVQTVTGP